jgi:hypothetical protein
MTLLARITRAGISATAFKQTPGALESPSFHQHDHASDLDHRDPGGIS